MQAGDLIGIWTLQSFHLQDLATGNGGSLGANALAACWC